MSTRLRIMVSVWLAAAMSAVGALASGGEKPERLSVRTLEENERVVVTYISAGPGYLLRRIYSIDGGAARRFTAIEQESVYDGRRRELPSELEPIGTTDLSDEEAHGLDVYFTFLRMEYPGECYAYDKLTIDHFRDGRLLSSESYHDKTCVASWFTRKKGEVVIDGYVFMDFPPELLQVMRPILLIEQRMWEEKRNEAKAEERRRAGD